MKGRSTKSDVHPQFGILRDERRWLASDPIDGCVMYVALEVVLTIVFLTIAFLASHCSVP